VRRRPPHQRPHRPCPNPQAERTSRKAGLADRLVNGLSGENKRWSETIRTLEAQEGMLVGDALLAAAFVSYAGPFNMAFRQQLVTERWLPDILERGIPISKGEAVVSRWPCYDKGRALPSAECSASRFCHAPSRQCALLCHASGGLFDPWRPSHMFFCFVATLSHLPHLPTQNRHQTP
jgi:hypothetical protein